MHSPELLVHEAVAAAEAESTPQAATEHGEDDVSVNSPVQRRAERDGIAIHLICFVSEGGSIWSRGATHWEQH